MQGATKDIGTLISEIQGQTQQAVSAMASETQEVHSGTALAGDAGTALARIQSVVSEMSARVLSINAASEEMSATAAEVSASVQTVAGTTSSQGAAVEELVASASELAGISQSLSLLVSQFRVVDDSSASQASKPLSSKPNLARRKAA